MGPDKAKNPSVINSSKSGAPDGYSPTVCDKENNKRINKEGIIGYIWTAEINVSDLVPKNEVYLLAPAEYVGVIPCRQEVTHCTKDIYAQESGMCILNDYAISSVNIKG